VGFSNYLGFWSKIASSDGIPEQKSFTTPDVRGHVVMTLTSGFWDLAEEHQAEVERLNQNLTPAR
jgi:hypothetical protein